MDGAKAYNYIAQSSMTATPGELLIMLLNAAVKNIKMAIISLNSNNFPEAHEKMIKAQSIIEELIYSLDDRYEISKSLSSLYFFIKREIIEANVKKDVKKLEEVLPLVVELRDTWEEAYRISRLQK